MSIANEIRNRLHGVINEQRSAMCHMTNTMLAVFPDGSTGKTKALELLQRMNEITRELEQWRDS